VFWFSFVNSSAHPSLPAECLAWSLDNQRMHGTSGCLLVDCDPRDHEVSSKELRAIEASEAPETKAAETIWPEIGGAEAVNRVGGRRSWPSNRRRCDPVLTIDPAVIGSRRERTDPVRVDRRWADGAGAITMFWLEGTGVTRAMRSASSS
jgi:hypothetical protein